MASSPPQSPRRYRIVICRGPECGDRRGSASLQAAFREALDARGIGAPGTPSVPGTPIVELAWQSCFGRCTQGPNVLVRELVEASGPTLGTGFATLPGPRGVTALYNHTDAERAERIVNEHVCQGRIVREYIEPAGAAGVLRSEPVASKPRES